MPELVVQGLAKQFSGAPAITGVDLTIRDGEFFTLLGPSGCGKSTTLSIIAGLTEPDQGVIKVGDTVFVDTNTRQFLPPERRNIGMVFQSYALWPHMTIAENLAVPMKVRRIGRAERERRIEAVLAQVGLSDLHQRYPHQLSGGQQQRVALARALVYEPSVLLLDEPLSNLDAKLRDRARAWLKQLQRDVKVTTLYVTHDQVEALSLSDRIAVMANQRVIQVGTPREIYEQPATPEVASFVGRCNFLHGHVVEAGADDSILVRLRDCDASLRVRTHETFAKSDLVTIGIRAEKVKLGEAAGGPRANVNALRMRIASKSYVGARFEYQLRLGEQLVHAEDVANVDATEVTAFIPDDCIVFPDTGHRPVNAQK